MSSREWWLRVQNILGVVEKIERHTANLTFDAFRENELVLQAVLYNFIIVGEAAKSIPAEIQLRYPEIAWRDISDTRNVVAHEYFQLKLITIWETIQDDLPVVKRQLQELLQRELNDRSESRFHFLNQTKEGASFKRSLLNAAYLFADPGSEI